MLSLRTLMSLATAMTAASGANATIWYVRSQAPSGGNGLSWGTAFTSFQSAISAAQPGDSVYVTAGVYTPSVMRDAGVTRSKTFALRGGVRYLAGFPFAGGTLAERDPVNYLTWLHGDLNGDDLNQNFNNYGDNCYHVVYLAGNQSGTVIDGFTFMHGNANGTTSDYNQGGGVCLSASMSGVPQLRNCSFFGDFASDMGAGLSGQHIAVINSVFRDNRTGAQGAGGAAFAGDAQFIGCKFLGNQALSGGGVFQYAAGMSLTNCLFSGNKALAADTLNPGKGGGANLLGGSTTSVTNCTFIGNAATVVLGTPQDAQGGGIWITSAPTLSPINNCILWDNTRQRITAGTVTTVTDGLSQLYYFGSLQLGWSIIQEFQGGTGTAILTSDPQFVNARGPDGIYGTFDDDATLLQTSPAIDSGNSDVLPSDMFDLDGDGNTAEPIPVDLAGRARCVDDLNVPNTGAGALRVDRGAYERPFCYANCDGSTTAPVLNVLDISCFLNRFAAGDSYANCDGSTTAPVLNVLDFACFLNTFAAGCP